GSPLPGVAISASRALIVFFPLALLGQELIGLNGIFIAAALSNLLIGFAGYIWFGYHLRRHHAV
ncbi:MAG: MATE family efflux transporter, partial [Gammaproteobacteria bacterium]